VWAAVTREGRVVRQPSPGPSRAIEIMAGVRRRPGTYLTYTGVTPQTVRCEGGNAVVCEATTWTDAETGTQLRRRRRPGAVAEAHAACC
jgi:hypothetical protein